MRRIYGVDFSGAKNAGALAWITGGKSNNEHLEIDICQPISKLPGSSTSRDLALFTLCKFVLESCDGIFGFDFPPSIPHGVIKYSSWLEMVKHFERDFIDPADFRNKCFASANQRELKRTTDCEAKTPFSPYNIRMYKQTYYGIRYLLLPLVASGAYVLPLQKAQRGAPWIIEICPASTLKKHNIYRSYKGRSEKAATHRTKIMSELKRLYALYLSKEHEEIILKNKKGDALDSLIAALATFESYKNKDLERSVLHPYNLEGWVFT